MSYCRPRNISKAKVFYPNYWQMKDGRVIPTGPYRKEIAGTTPEAVYLYLAHLEEKYDEVKKSGAKIV